MRDSITHIDGDTHDAIVLYDLLIRTVAYSGMYSDRCMTMVRDMIDRPGYHSGITARQRYAMHLLIDASQEDDSQ